MDFTKAFQVILKPISISFDTDRISCYQFFLLLLTEPVLEELNCRPVLQQLRIFRRPIALRGLGYL